MANIQIIQGDFEKKLKLQFAPGIKAGFPSPAEDYSHETLDFNRDLIRNPEATFYGKVEGDSMIEAGINDGDIAVIDRSIEAQDGDIVVGYINDEFTIKYLDLRHRKDGYIELRPDLDYKKVAIVINTIIMKKILTSILLLFVVLCSYAQTKRYYCEVKGIEKELSSGLKIIFDFGNQASYNMWGDLSSKLKFVDEKNGEEIKFNSMVDAANYMVEKGWSFQQAYSSAYGGHPVIHWIFYKDAETIEEAKKGIMTKEEYNKAHK